MVQCVFGVFLFRAQREENFFSVRFLVFRFFVFRAWGTGPRGLVQESWTGEPLRNAWGTDPRGLIQKSVTDPRGLIQKSGIGGPLRNEGHGPAFRSRVRTL